MVEEKHHWLLSALTARIILSAAAIAYARAVEASELSFAPLRSEAARLLDRQPLLRSMTAVRQQAGYWLSAGLCVLTESILVAVVVQGGAIALPLLLPASVFFDACARALLLREPLPKRHVLTGGGLAALAAVVASHFAPPFPVLSGSAMFVAFEGRSLLVLLFALVCALALAELIETARLLRHERDLAVLLAVHGGLFGSLGALCTAALGSCLRHEFEQRRLRQFDSPCALQLAAVASLAYFMQGRKLTAAHGLGGERSGVSRVHSTTVVVVAPALIGVFYASAPHSISDDALRSHQRGSTKELLGFGSWFDLCGFILTLLIGVLSLNLVYRPRAAAREESALSPGAQQRDMDPHLAALLDEAERHHAKRLKEQPLHAASSRSSKSASSSAAADGEAAAPAASAASAAPAANAALDLGRVGGDAYWADGETDDDPTHDQSRREKHSARRAALAKPLKARKTPMKPTDFQCSLSYLVPETPRAPSFRPSKPLLAFSRSHPHAALMDDAASLEAQRAGASGGGGLIGGSAISEAALQAEAASAAARARVAASSAAARARQNAAVGYSPRCRSALSGGLTAETSAYTPAPRARVLHGSSPGGASGSPVGGGSGVSAGRFVGAASPELMPEFIRGHPAAAEVATLWGFTGQLRANGVRAAAWPPQSSGAVPPPLPLEYEEYEEEEEEEERTPEPQSPATPPPQAPRDEDEEPAGTATPRPTEEDLAREAAVTAIGEDGVARLRLQLLAGLGAPCVLAPLFWWLASDGTMRSDELILIGVACVCIACVLFAPIHTAALWYVARQAGGEATASTGAEGAPTADGWVGKSTPREPPHARPAQDEEVEALLEKASSSARQREARLKSGTSDERLPSGRRLEYDA